MENVYKKLGTDQVSVLRETEFSAVSFISRFLHRHGAQNCTKSAHGTAPRRVPSEKTAKEGGAGSEGGGGPSPLTPPLCLKPRQGPNPSRSPLASFF